MKTVACSARGAAGCAMSSRRPPWRRSSRAGWMGCCGQAGQPPPREGMSTDLRNARCTSGKPMTATRKDTAAAIAANRFGLGARPGELAAVALDPQDWLVRQLKGSPPVLTAEGLKPSAETLAKVIELRKEVAEERREAQVATALKLPAVYRPVYM